MEELKSPNSLEPHILHYHYSQVEELVEELDIGSLAIYGHNKEA